MGSARIKGTYAKNKRLVIALAAVAWFGVLLQLFITLHSTIHNGKGVLGGIGRLQRRVSA